MSAKDCELAADNRHHAERQLPEALRILAGTASHTRAAGAISSLDAVVNVDLRA